MGFFTKHRGASASSGEAPAEPRVPAYVALEDHQIRILELLPGTFDQPLECHLVPVSVFDLPSYEALSYVWGSPVFNKSITCDGVVVDITENLFFALRRLRNEHDPRYLWADAVCINQRDAKEKSVQIQRMRDIYAKSTEVAVWLGEECEDSDAAMALVNETAAKWAREGGRPHGTTNEDGKANPLQHIQTFRNGPVRSLLRVVRRPYFSRVWVIQEVALAADRATVYLGAGSAPWSAFADVCAWAVESGIAMFAPSRFGKPLMLRETGEHTVDKRTNGIEPDPKADLLPLLLRFRGFSATDARDKVYGLLGLADASKQEEPFLDVDYGKDKEEVYRDVAVTILRKSGNLDILSVPRVLEPTTLPSWVPRWDVSDQQSSLLISDLEKTRTWRASGESEPYVNWSRMPDQLGVSAMTFAVVEEVGNIWERQDISEVENMTKGGLQAYDAVRYQIKTGLEWEAIAGVESADPYPPTGEARSDVFFQTGIGGCSSLEEYKEMKAKFDSANTIYRRHRLLHDLKLDRHFSTFLVGGMGMAMAYNAAVALKLKSVETLTPQDFDFQNAVNEAATHKRMFRSENGYLGLGPKRLEKGDLVVLVKGGRAPLVLRESDKDGAMYELIGDAYVHGAMDGKLFDESQCRNIWLV
ncbi:heterokaryon incompatibility protein-domain-containing protein [Xylariaceae sp. FL0662B]|nr:heterokaryon incompatibility protein-domain-containing protein [Xylariaceae sp. FL0662B]